MAISQVEIVNKALTLCGANPITNLTDSSNNARIVNRVYEISLKSILSECAWNFAIKRRLLSTVERIASTTSATSIEWFHTNEAYIYAKPVDIVRIFGCNDDDAEWREVGDQIVADVSGFGIKYVYYLEDPSKYSASFIEAFIDKLCSDISYMIINSASKAEAFLAKYQKVSLPKAMAENAQIGTQQYLKDDAWEMAKYNDTIASA